MQRETLLVSAALRGCCPPDGVCFYEPGMDGKRDHFGVFRPGLPVYGIQQRLKRPLLRVLLQGYCSRAGGRFNAAFLFFLL